MIKDYIVPGAIVGLLADAAKLAANYGAYLLGFTPVVFWQITATRFLEKKELFGPLAYLIGGIADITVSAALGVVFVYFIYLFTSRYLWIKGIGFGLLVWVGLFGTLLGQSAQAKLPQNALGILVTLVAHFVFGLAMAFFTKILILKKFPLEQTNSGSKSTGARFKIKLSPAPAKKQRTYPKAKPLRKPYKIK